MSNKSIRIETPRDCNVKVNTTSCALHWNSSFGTNWGGRFNRAQQFVDSEVLRLSSPYVPFRTGMLDKSGTLGTQIGSGEVNWIAPYAAAQYYNTADSRSYDAQRGGHWFERMKANHRDEILRGAKKLGGGNG